MGETIAATLMKVVGGVKDKKREEGEFARMRSER
jgi:hypothetical protein